ncbi:diguanylate cyclase [Photobacterium nomapromontoriensis]|uniref:diguanylate cyclase n=1 Tax=Photobacterium nomapromontoriensis TaxID=2910237 RepID=UPI003D0D7A0C
MMSLRNILTFIVLLGSLLPAYWMGASMIEKHQNTLLVEKESKLVNTTKSIRNTIEHELTVIANLTRWYSKDRLLVQGMDNILYSSVIRPKIETFEKLATNVSATYILDKDWQPMYESNGSLYHLEISKLLTQIRHAQKIYEKGQTFHTAYSDEHLVLKGGQSGIALVSPLLPYTLLPGSDYEPQGYIVVLVSFDALAQLSKPFLYQQESAEFHYGIMTKLGYNENRYLSYVTINNDWFNSPLKLTIVHRVSDAERNKELAQSKAQLLHIIIVTLLVTFVIALLISRWLTRPIREIERVVRSFQRQIRPNLDPKKYQFSEFKQLVSLIDSLWLKIAKQMDELEDRNKALKGANQQVQDTNIQLADFNQRLEHTVAEQTAELRASLTREEQYQVKLMTLINFSAAHAGIGYHAIPEMINAGLSKLLPRYDIKFSFSKPAGQHVKTMLSSNGDELGYVDFGDKTLSDDDTILFELFNKQLYAWLELEDFARRDKLSACFNRKAFDDDFEYAREAIAKDLWTSMSILIVDINGLKNLNDTYGHDRGDALIKTCSALIHSALDAQQTLYRIGGDEFAIIAKECCTTELNTIISKLDAVQKDRWIELSENNPYPVQFSVGGASSETESLKNLISIADKDMYRKKREYYDSGSGKQN